MKVKKSLGIQDPSPALSYRRDQPPPSPPTHAGDSSPLSDFSKDIEECETEFQSTLLSEYTSEGESGENWKRCPVFDTDAQCDELVGRQFVCDIDGPCKVTHWSVDSVNPCATERWVYYLPDRVDSGESRKATLPEV